MLFYQPNTPSRKFFTTILEFGTFLKNFFCVNTTI